MTDSFRRLPSSDSISLVVDFDLIYFWCALRFAFITAADVCLPPVWISKIVCNIWNSSILSIKQVLQLMVDNCAVLRADYFATILRDHSQLLRTSDDRLPKTVHRPTVSWHDEPIRPMVVYVYAYISTLHFQLSYSNQPIKMKYLIDISNSCSNIPIHYIAHEYVWYIRFQNR